MVPLVVLLVVSVLARVAGLAGCPWPGSWAASVAVGLAAMLAVTASAHFANPLRRGLIAIVPAALPRPDLVVTLTGVLEAALVPGFLVLGWRTASAAVFLLLLVAVFPANVRAARGVDEPAAPRTPLGPRIAEQVLFGAACVVVALG